MSLPILITTGARESCSIMAVLRRVGDKWTPVLLSLLFTRAYGFNELHRSVEGLSRRMLTRTLRTLERDGLIDKASAHANGVVHSRYALTDLGRSLCGQIASLGRWATGNAAELSAAHVRFDARVASRP